MLNVVQEIASYSRCNISITDIQHMEK